ncbi:MULTISPECIES: M10 family metallopeptidase C-terminal domain-containing protein [unclassified Devosia]|uniref:M10 family metallopeptidase C-terminal domain-containing protein n=1 Tax=unclassified Devosia TaxID=196773 RepID=UPI00155566B5|nr:MULTISPECIES: M10 family metallopeptidase C-terminal domain-containing protein [unclassified Devosia]
MPLDLTRTLQGFPDADSTGVRSGVNLKQVGGFTVTEDNAVISGLDIRGTLTIEAKNVTIVDCRIVGNSYNGIISQRNDVTVEHCDIVGGTNGISGSGTFRYNDISQVDNGINVYSPSVIEHNYIHDLEGGPDAHYDGIEINGGGGSAEQTIIRHNTIINDHGQTSAIMIDNYFGGVGNILIDNNYLTGGGYTIYSDGRFTDEQISGVQITNNVLGEGQWGYYAFFENRPQVSGNTEIGDLWPLPDSGGAPNEPAPQPQPQPQPDPDPQPQQPGGTGTDAADTLTGDGAANVLDGRAGNDVINGAGGNDTIIGGLGRDTLTGGAGNDLFVFKNVAEMGRSAFSRDVITDFTPGQDKIDLSALDANNQLAGKQGFTWLAQDNASFTGRAGELAWHTEAGANRTVIQGDTNGDRIHDFEIQLSGIVKLSASDIAGLASGTTPSPAPEVPPATVISGTSRSDNLVGDDGANSIDGRGGNDTIDARGGADTIIGGWGWDTMTGGGGDDTFVFRTAAETGSYVGSRDVITDFEAGRDTIDLSSLDADPNVDGIQSFSFLARNGASFTGTRGEIAWHTEPGQNRTVVQGDVNGDGRHDFEIELSGTVQLTANDFLF